jgi:hypothetical protein
MKKKNVIVFTLLAGLSLSFYSSEKASAAENLEVLPVQSTHNSITLSWSEASNSYELYKDSTLIYKGDSEQFVDNDLEAEHPYQYFLTSLDQSGNFVDKVKIKTRTQKLPVLQRTSDPEIEINESNASFNDIRIDSFVTNDELSLDWTDIIGVSEYVVYKNDELIETTKDSEIIDKINPTQSYLYRIIAKRPMTEDEIAARKQNDENAGDDASLVNPDSEYIVQYVVTKKIDPVKEELETLSSRAALSLNYTLRYQTFIPAQYVKAPLDFFQNRYLRGNGRGYDPDANYNSKTNSDNWVCFCTTPDVTFYKNVGPTDIYKLVNGEYVYDGTEQASTNGITMTNLSKTSSKISFKVYHDVGIPIKINGVSPPNINVEFAADFWSDGSYDISGYHDGAPSHEMYMRDNGRWDQLVRDDILDFMYLAPPVTDFFFHAEK